MATSSRGVSRPRRDSNPKEKTPREFKALTQKILPWYKQFGRSLPWRKSKNPYRIWISEVMLQQTQVQRVIPYYERFLRRFPNVNSLSKASWREILPFWRGLGYYQRGKNLGAAAKVIQTQYGGKFPRVEEELRQLPGIGSYTASAILSFAFGQAIAAVDTNLRRVLSRFFGCDPKAVESMADKLYAAFPQYSAELNHALMDVGALFCRSRNPNCLDCPLAQNCCSREKFILAPAGPKKKKPVDSLRPDIHVSAACIHREGRYLLAQRQNGCWEFPGGKLEPGEDVRACLKREIWEELGVEVSVRPAYFKKDFQKSGKRYRIHFCRSQVLRGFPKALEHKQIRWLKPEEILAMRLLETNRDAAELLLSTRPASKSDAR